MSQNIFKVDLGNLNLSEEQQLRINSAIQSAVSHELAQLSISGRIVFVPNNRTWPGPWIWGFIARQLDEGLYTEVLGKEGVAGE